MSTHEELIHTENREGFEINVYALPFEINVYALPEDISPEEQFSNKDNATDQDILNQIERGDLTWFVAKVTASKAGIELGVDRLGACCYKNYKDFITAGNYLPDMISNVITEANTKIKELIS